MSGTQDIQLDLVTHDILIEGYDLELIDERERIQQQLTIHLLTAKGEWFLNILHGIPYLESVWTKPIDQSLIVSILKAAILEVNDVLSVTSFTVDFDESLRTITITFSITTTFGRITDITVEA